MINSCCHQCSDRKSIILDSSMRTCHPFHPPKKTCALAGSNMYNAALCEHYSTPSRIPRAYETIEELRGQLFHQYTSTHGNNYCNSIITARINQQLGVCPAATAYFNLHVAGQQLARPGAP